MKIFLPGVLTLLLFAAVPLYSQQPQLDTTFNFTGKQTTDMTDAGDNGRAMVVQADNKIVVIGGAGGAFGAVRYNTDGSLDGSFGKGGKAIVDFDVNLNDYAAAASLQSDGKIVLVGTLRANALMISNFAVIRLGPDGTLDTSFGSGGRVVTPVDETAEDMATAVVIQPDGKLVVVGRTLGTNLDYQAVVRYNPDGSLDTLFGTGGIVKTSIAGHRGWATSVAMQSDGKIIVGGGIHTAPNPPNAIYFGAIFRYNSNGTLDTTFDGDGYVTFADGDTDGVRAVAVQPDGKIVAATPSLGIVRLNADGSFDNTFSGDGRLTAAIDPRSITLNANGRITVAGNHGGDFAVARYDVDGALDTTFSHDGRFLVDFGASSNDRVGSVAVDSRGRVVLGGDANATFAAVRLRAAASATVSGRVLMDDGHPQPVRNALVYLDDGRGSVRTARTNSFGYYSFFAVPTRPGYTVSTVAKKYMFMSRTVDIFDDLMNLDLVASEP